MPLTTARQTTATVGTMPSQGGPLTMRVSPQILGVSTRTAARQDLESPATPVMLPALAKTARTLVVAASTQSPRHLHLALATRRRSAVGCRRCPASAVVAGWALAGGRVCRAVWAAAACPVCRPIRSLVVYAGCLARQEDCRLLVERRPLLARVLLRRRSLGACPRVPGSAEGCRRCRRPLRRLQLRLCRLAVLLHTRPRLVVAPRRRPRGRAWLPRRLQRPLPELGWVAPHR
jgi:hypothetical protein